MKKVSYVIVVVAFLLGVVASTAYAVSPITDKAVLKDLAAVRAATAKYHDVNVALADGYVPVGECLEVPGVGTMGIHYLNPVLAMNPALDVTKPELLLYIPNGKGLKLVAVEYFRATVEPPAIPDPAPVLFNATFDGPMAGHEPGMPWHYDLHVWVWANNPAGMTAQFNPNIHCGE